MTQQLPAAELISASIASFGHYMAAVEAMIARHTTRERILSGEDKFTIAVLAPFEIQGVSAAHLLIGCDDPMSPKAVDLCWCQPAMSQPASQEAAHVTMAAIGEWVAASIRAIVREAEHPCGRGQGGGIIAKGEPLVPPGHRISAVGGMTEAEFRECEMLHPGVRHIGTFKGLK